MNRSEKYLYQIHIIEAEKIGQYLINASIHDSEKETYLEAMLKLEINFSDFENKLWQKMIRSKWEMTVIDAGLALIDPLNNVRRKIFTMLAILEASPNYTKHFIAKKQPFFYIFKIGIIGMGSILKAIVGVIRIKIIRINAIRI